MSLRLIITEDDIFTREALATALKSFNFEIVAACKTAGEVIEALSVHEVEALLLDVDLGPGPTGLDVAHLLSTRRPNLGLVLLSSSADPRLVRASLPAVPEHAIYLVKSQVTAIEQIAEALILAHQNAVNGSSSEPHGFSEMQLTDVQIETLRMVANGMSNAEIAKLRFVTEKAVESTISKIAKALDLPSGNSNNQRVHAARMYFRLRGQA